MLKKNIRLISFIGFITIVFILTSLLDFFLSRESQKKSGPSAIPTISLMAPAFVEVGEAIELTWTIDTPTPRHIAFTTIYYDLESTPSAVMATDSPAALGYKFSLSDFIGGDWTSPQTFTTRLYPPGDANVLFLRAYAQIDNNHYWTNEQKITIE